MEMAAAEEKCLVSNKFQGSDHEVPFCGLSGKAEAQWFARSASTARLRRHNREGGEASAAFPDFIFSTFFIHMDEQTSQQGLLASLQGFGSDMLLTIGDLLPASDIALLRLVNSHLNIEAKSG
jgi:hypothetical protein